MQTSMIVTGRLDVPTLDAETDLYRLIVFNGSGTHVLLESRNAARFLPEVEIPRFTRPAQQITSVLRERWGIAAVLLWRHHLDSTDRGAVKLEPRYAILEVLGAIQDMPATLDWFPVQRAASCLDEEEKRLLGSSQAKAMQPSFGI